jgi:hypothetical protein
VQRPVGVADAGEHVCDWIGQHWERSPPEQIAFTGRENQYAFAFGMTQKCV